MALHTVLLPSSVQLSMVVCPCAPLPELRSAAQVFASTFTRSGSALFSYCRCKVLPELLAFCPLHFGKNSCCISICSEGLWWLLVLTVEGLQNGSCWDMAAMCRRSWQTSSKCQSWEEVMQLLQVEGGVSYNLAYIPWDFEVWLNMMHNDTYSAFASRRLPLCWSVSSVNFTSMQSAYSDVTTKMRFG